MRDDGSFFFFVRMSHCRKLIDGLTYTSNAVCLRMCDSRSVKHESLKAMLDVLCNESGLMDEERRCAFGRLFEYRNRTGFVGNVINEFQERKGLGAWNVG